MMQTSALTRPAIRKSSSLNFQPFIFTLKQRGFSLLEILIALMIVAMIGAIGLNFSSFGINSMDQAVDEVERAIRFASDEAVLRGSMVRLKIQMDEEPATYEIEHGPAEGFILPEYASYDENISLSLEDLEYLEQQEEKVQSQFRLVEEFSAGSKELPSGIRVMGMASDLRSNKLFLSGVQYLYFYPTGERDNGLIILASEEEIIGIEMLAFQPVINRQYKTFNLSNVGDWDQYLVSQAEELHEAWLQNE